VNNFEAYIFVETAESASGIVFGKVITAFDMTGEQSMAEWAVCG